MRTEATSRYEKIEDLKAKNKKITTAEACRRFKVLPGAYYAWRSSLRAKNGPFVDKRLNQTAYNEIRPEVPGIDSMLCLVVGPAREIAKFWKNVNGGRK